jgi:hypothetical protein
VRNRRTTARKILLRAPVLLSLIASAAFAWSPEEASHLLRQSGRILLHNAQFDITDGPPLAAEDLRLSAEELSATRYWIVQYQGTPSRFARQTVQARGGEVLSYIPNQAYLVRLDPAEARFLLHANSFRWMGPYRPDYKLAPGVGTTKFSDPDRAVVEGELLLTLSAFEGEDLDRIASAAVDRGADILGINRHPATPRIGVRIERGGERRLAHIEGLEWIETVGEMTLRNNETRWVAQTNQLDNTRVWDMGLHGENQIIGHIDIGLWMPSCYFKDLKDNTPGPDHRKIVAWRGPPEGDTHGTLTAGIAVGHHYDGNLLNAGQAYAARLSHTEFSLITGEDNGPSNVYSYLEAAHDDGARIHSNSWGSDSSWTFYTTWCVDIDRYSRDFEDDLILLAVSNSDSLETPENAKNLLAVGGSRQAPFQDSVWTAGEGPTSDGRRKPEIFLPGASITTARPAVCNVTHTAWGTSMACPAVAAYGAIVRQYYEEGFYPSGVANTADALAPTGALVKATLLNGAVNMTGEPGYPSDQEGWGRLLLDGALYFPGDTRNACVRDVRHAEGLATGGFDEYFLDVVGSAEPLQVTMVFTDQPAALAAEFAPINDLDLEVEGPDGLFLGNVFAAEVSTTGGAADPLNNVERVVLPASGFTGGVWTVRVRGRSVPDGPQGYALHISGDVLQPTAAGTSPLPEATADRFLAQNKPNPFSMTTMIRFSLPERNEVNLSVFDVSGRRIQTLLQGEIEAGEYSVTWNGRDLLGQRVAAGIYLYRLEGSGIDATRKLVVVR